MTTDEKLWTVADVANYLGVSRRSVFNLAGLPRVELPGRGERKIVRYAPDEVREWAANRSTRRRDRAA